MPEQLLLDPTDEASGTQLDISDGTSYGLIDHAYPVPPMNAVYASSVDTEGGNPAALTYQNRVVTIKVRVVGTSAANLEARLGAVSRKVGKFQREGGTLRRVTPAGTSITFDVLPDSSGGVTSFGKRYINNEVAEIELTFTCRPFGRGAAVQLSDHTETTNPEIVFTEAGIDGDVPGLGKLVIDEDQGADQWFVMWGIQSRFYDSATSAKLVWAASEITALGTSTLTAGATGAFGGGSNVIRNTDLATTFQAIASTQATGGGAHLSHVGDFVVWARVYCPTGNTGNVEVALEWAEGDFRRFTRNASWSMDSSWEGSWRLVNLGQVHPGKVPQGTQRWEGRIVARSTAAGDEIDVNRLWIMPCTEGYGEARAKATFPVPTAFTARDEFNQSAGALAGKTAPTGGNWAGSGDADDFSVETTGKTAQRTAVDDTSTGAGRFARLGSAQAATAVRVEFKSSVIPAASLGFLLGVGARYVDTSNFLVAGVGSLFDLGIGDSTEYRAWLCKVVSGALDVLGSVVVPTPEAATYYQIRLTVGAGGHAHVWYGRADVPLGAPLVAAHHSDLATGGTLDDGAPFMYDAWEAGTAATRNFDNFAAWTPPADAAIFASQSLELRHDQVVREDSAGTLWPEVSDYQGRHLFIPPAGQEGRTSRLIVKASRADPDTMGDHTAADDISARLTYTPRYLQVPEA